MSKRYLFFLWAIVTILSMLILVSIVRYRQASDEAVKEAITQLTGLTFTAGARIDNYYYERGLDAALLAKATVPYAELDEFLQNTPFRVQTLMPGADVRFTSSGPSWWTPDTHKTYRAGEDTGNPQECYRMLISWDQPDHAVGYVEWFEIY